MSKTDSPSASEKRMPARWLVVTLGLCSICLLIGRYTAHPEAPTASNRQQMPIAAPNAAEDFEPIEPYGPIVANSRGDYAPELIRKASHILNGYTLRVHDVSRDKSS